MSTISENYDFSRLPRKAPPSQIPFRAILKTAYFNKTETIVSIPEYRTLDPLNDSTDFAKLDKIKDDVETELYEYLNFPRGWDGYDGEKFDRELISTVIYLVDLIAEFFKDEGVVPSEITPGPASDGSVDLEVAYKDKVAVFTLYPDEESMIVYLEYGRESYEERINIGGQTVATKLLWLVN